MGKSTYFTGQPVYSQVVNLLDKGEIVKISKGTKGSEAYVKRLDGYQHLIVMLFGILKHFDSLRELEIGMKAEAHKLQHLGLTSTGVLCQGICQSPETLCQVFSGQPPLRKRVQGQYARAQGLGKTPLYDGFYYDHPL